MTREVWDQIHDLWFTMIVLLPLGHGGFSVLDAVLFECHDIS